MVRASVCLGLRLLLRGAPGEQHQSDRGQRPWLPVKTVDSISAAASAGFAHRARRPDRPSQKMSTTEVELVRKMSE